jgi:hypothetical protein
MFKTAKFWTASRLLVMALRQLLSAGDQLVLAGHHEQPSRRFSNLRDNTNGGQEAEQDVATGDRAASKAFLLPPRHIVMRRQEVVRTGRSIVTPWTRTKRPAFTSSITDHSAR